MAIRKQNKELIAKIETDIKNNKNAHALSIQFEITKDDYLSIAEWLYKTYNSIRVDYNGDNIVLLIGL